VSKEEGKRKKAQSKELVKSYLRVREQELKSSQGARRK
jgi:hypothetical protein